MNNSGIRLALHYVANNCVQDGATAVITLRGSGVQIAGKIQKPLDHNENVVVETERGGWAAITISEIAAVEARLW